MSESNDTGAALMEAVKTQVAEAWNISPENMLQKGKIFGEPRGVATLLLRRDFSRPYGEIQRGLQISAPAIAGVEKQMKKRFSADPTVRERYEKIKANVLALAVAQGLPLAEESAPARAIAPRPKVDIRIREERLMHNGENPALTPAEKRVLKKVWKRRCSAELLLSSDPAAFVEQVKSEAITALWQDAETPVERIAEIFSTGASEIYAAIGRTFVARRETPATRSPRGRSKNIVAEI